MEAKIVAHVAFFVMVFGLFFSGFFVGRAYEYSQLVHKIDGMIAKAASYECEDYYHE